MTDEPHYCRRFIQVQDSYIPSMRPSTTDATATTVVGVPQWECLGCGKKWGWLPVNAQVVHRAWED